MKNMNYSGAEMERQMDDACVRLMSTNFGHCWVF